MEQENKSESKSRSFFNRPRRTATPLGISTGISVTRKEKEYYTKFTTLNPTAEPLPQGDGVIRISPFDDYIIFTLYDETGQNGDLADTPIDLSNVGTLNLVFIGENDEIRIPNWTKVKEVDLSQGQVLFKIDKESSKKILSLDNNNFYISTRMVDENGISDESVLYTGTFLGIKDAAEESMTAKLKRISLQYAKELAKLQSEIERLNRELAEMLSLDEDQIATIKALEASNLSLTDQVAELSAQLCDAQSELILEEAKNAQLLAEQNKKKRQQIQAITKKTKTAPNNKKVKKYFKQASKLNQEFTTRQGPIEDIDSIRTIKDLAGRQRRNLFRRR